MAVGEVDPAREHVDPGVGVRVQELPDRRQPAGVRGALRSTGQVRQRPVPVAVQQREQLGQPRLVVGRDHRRARQAGVSVDQDDGFQLGHQGPQLRLRHPGGAEHEPVAAAPGLDGQDALVLHRLGGVGDQDVVAVARGGAAEAPQHAVEGGVLQVGHDHRDGAGPAEHQAAGERAGGVVELPRRRAHPLGQRLVDRGVAVEHPRDRGQRDARPRRDVGDGPRPGPRFPCHPSPPCRAPSAVSPATTSCSRWPGADSILYRENAFSVSFDEQESRGGPSRPGGGAGWR